MAESAMKRLAAMATRCNDLSDDRPYGDVAQARALPDKLSGNVRRLRVSASNYDRPSAEEVALFQRVQKAMEAQERARGERGRRTQLLALADELDRLRRDMAALMPHAVVELAGRVAELRKEASNG